MMKNEVFALECRRRYAEDGLVVDASNGEFAHCPLPRGMGDTGYYLLHDDHQWQGLLQSEDVGRKCFFDYYARKFLVEGPFVEGYFGLWDTYEKWSRGQWEKGKGWYKDPATGETALLTRKEAAETGWVGICSGTAPYRCPGTGEVKRLTPEEAKQRGWVSVTAGTGTYKDPETGVKERLSREEAKQRGWVHVQTGAKRKFKTVKCPHCGKEGGANIMPRHHFDNCKHRQE